MCYLGEKKNRREKGFVAGGPAAVQLVGRRRKCNGPEKKKKGNFFFFRKLTKRSRCRSAGFIRPTCGRSGCSGLHVVTCNAAPWACAYVPHCHRHTTGADWHLIKFLPINSCSCSAILSHISTSCWANHINSPVTWQSSCSLIGADYVQLSPECHFHSSGGGDFVHVSTLAGNAVRKFSTNFRPNPPAADIFSASARSFSSGTQRRSVNDLRGPNTLNKTWWFTPHSEIWWP